MANFKTHVSVAAIGSGLLATVFLGGGIATPRDVVLLSVAGTLGGILPDIDSDNSSPIRLLFTLLAIIFAFLVMFNRAATYSIVELWLVWGFSYSVVRYLALEAFKGFTIHRGIFHSIVTALFFGFLTTAFCYRIFDLSVLLSWTIGFFLFFGFIIHLSLDEVYSVDFMNRRLKRSFGTALKLVDYNNNQTSLLMSFCAILTFFMTPTAYPFTSVLFNLQTYQNMLNNFLPRGTWFEF